MGDELFPCCGVAGHHDTAIQALKMATEVHVQTSPLDGQRLSRCYHSLAQLVLSQGGGVAGEEGEQEEGWRVLCKVLDLLDSTAKVRGGGNYVTEEAPLNNVHWKKCVCMCVCT